MSNTNYPMPPQGQPTPPLGGQPFSSGHPIGTDGPGPMGWQAQPMTPAEAATFAKAAKAHAKSLRPWFKKKRFVVPIVSVALMTASNVAGRAQTAPLQPQRRARQPLPIRPTTRPQNRRPRRRPCRRPRWGRR